MGGRLCRAGCLAERLLQPNPMSSGRCFEPACQRERITEMPAPPNSGETWTCTFKGETPSEFQETQRGPEIHESQSYMEDWDADLSPCNFVTAHHPAERSSYLPVTS